MQVTVNVECTPEEARAFLGLPDVSMLNEMMVAKVAAQAESNMDAMNPTELINTWMKFGGMMREQFMEAMTGAAASAQERNDSASKDRSGDD